MIRLLGTSHISPMAVKKIKHEIREGSPDCVCVELDPGRYHSLKYGEEGGYPSLFFRFLAWVQKRLGEKTGVLPGEEMLSAVETAQENSIDVYLIDQDISETLNDFKSVGILEKLKLFVKSLGFDKSEDFNLDEIPSYSLVNKAIKHIKKHSPELYRILVEKRNRRMFQAVRELSWRYDNILVVVGIGHLPGMKQLFSRDNMDFEDKTF